MQPTRDESAVLKSRTFLAMGTVVSLTAAFPAEGSPNPTELDAAVRLIEADFAELEERFSLYREDSEASALARGVIRLAHASPEMRDCYEEAVEWRRRTHGAFTAERPDGVLDLSGLVKGRAIAQAGDSLDAFGLRNWCLNAGGDVLVSGTPSPGDPGRSWLAGVVDPADRRTLLGAYPLGSGARRALATSGSAERGDHIWGVGGRKSEFVQVSVAGPDIVTADVLATAIVAGGRELLDIAALEWNVDILAVTRDGELFATPGFRAPHAA